MLGFLIFALVLVLPAVFVGWCLRGYWEDDIRLSPKADAEYRAWCQRNG